MSSTGRPSTGWHPATFPEERRGEMRVVEVADAQLTRVTRGGLAVVHRPTGWFRGAVHDGRGKLVKESQRFGGLGGAQRAAADPPRVGRPKPGVERVAGRWLYGGHWMRHFGHFITETVTCLWPDLRDDVEGLVFHCYYKDTPPDPEPYQLALLRLAGYDGLPIRLVYAEPLVVEQLVVPARPVVLNGWAHPEAVRVWDRMTAASGPPVASERVFLSRSGFHAEGGNPRREDRTSRDWDRALDAAMVEAGFAIVHPQRLPVDEQIRLAAGARVLAGSAGSALHLAAFGPDGRRVLEIGDPRSPDALNPMQSVVNAARGHEQAFIPYGDQRLLADGLRQLGLLEGPDQPRNPFWRRRRRS